MKDKSSVVSVQLAGDKTIGPAFSGGTSGSGTFIGGVSGGGAYPTMSGVQYSGTTPEELDKFLAASSLSPDLQGMVKAAYEAMATNDVDQANRLISAFNSASEFSDPYFKAQVAVVTDALKRGLLAEEGDLAFKETSLRDTLGDLVANLAASRDYLGFEKAQEIRALTQNYEIDLDNTQNDMAARGFSSSSIRTQKEDMLEDNFNNMVESTNRRFSYQTGQMDRQESSATRDTDQQIEYYRKLAEQNNTNLLRSAETQVGSGTLGDLGYTGLLGGQGGAIPEAQVKDALSFASNYVF